MAGLMRQVGAGIQTRSLNGMTPEELLGAVRRSLTTMLARQESLLIEEPDPQIGPGMPSSSATGRTLGLR